MLGFNFKTDYEKYWPTSINTVTFRIKCSWVGESRHWKNMRVIKIGQEFCAQCRKLPIEQSASPLTKWTVWFGVVEQAIPFPMFSMHFSMNYVRAMHNLSNLLAIPILGAKTKSDINKSAFMLTWCHPANIQLMDNFRCKQICGCSLMGDITWTGAETKQQDDMIWL